MSRDAAAAPGPRPAEFAFPFAPAAGAAAAIEDELADLAGARRTHEVCAHALSGRFEGRSRAAFETGLSAALAAADGARWRLEADLDALRSAIALAGQRRDAAEAALAAWQRRSRDYQTALREQAYA